jgi:lysophospholipase L1-like esterase
MTANPAQFRYFLACFITLVLSLFLGGCTSMETPDVTSDYRFLALGDSYTIGESVTEAERWPNQLTNRLRGNGHKIADPEIIARTGWTTAELADGIQLAEPQGPYDLVSLLIGVNNQYRGQSIDEYRTQFQELLARAIAFAGGEPSRVLVLSIPDWGVTPFAARRDTALISAEINAFNAVNKEESMAAGVRYINITPLSRQAAQNPVLTAADGLHPSGEMYATWVELVFPEALAALEK